MLHPSHRSLSKDIPPTQSLIRLGSTSPKDIRPSLPSSAINVFLLGLINLVVGQGMSAGKGVQSNDLSFQFLTQRPEIGIMRTVNIMRQLMTQHIPNRYCQSTYLKWGGRGRYIDTA